MGGRAVARVEPLRLVENDGSNFTNRQRTGERRPRSRGRLFVVDTVVEPQRRALVRAFDVAVAAAALLVLAPVVLLIATTVRCTSRGPVVFSHQRLGRHGRPFHCLKFRTMVDGAANQLPLLLRNDPALRLEFEENFKLHHDPRVTAIGRFLRATSLDELPQLVNVLRGEMSVVGPRPIVEAEAARYGSKLATVLSVKPGMTGLWQVSGRSDLSYDERVELDVRYTEDRSLAGDVGICFRTVRLMATGSGAY